MGAKYNPYLENDGTMALMPLEITEHCCPHCVWRDLRFNRKSCQTAREMDDSSYCAFEFGFPWHLDLYSTILGRKNMDHRCEGNLRYIKKKGGYPTNEETMDISEDQRTRQANYFFNINESPFDA